MAEGFLVHPIAPVFDDRSRVLILGSFPSAASRAQGFFYGHPRNRFWALLAGVFDDRLPQTIPEKKDFLLRHQVALWDVIASCRIRGSSDASIREVTVNDLSRILDRAPIQGIFCNGARSYELYCRWQQPVTGLSAVRLPSTSPANAAWSLTRLQAEWKSRLAAALNGEQ